MEKKIYEFYYSEGSFLMEIEAENLRVQELLNRYRESTRDKISGDLTDYNADDWKAFLDKVGIFSRFLEPEHEIYF